MKLFQTEIMICASVYVLAESVEEANAKVDALTSDGHAIAFSDRRQEIGDGIFMTGENYSPDMPEISLSPVMTIQSSPTKASCYETEDFDEDDDEGTDHEDGDECGQCDGTGTIYGGLGGDGEDEECPVCDGSGTRNI